MVPVALKVRDLLGARGIGTAVVNLLTIKPLDVRGIERVLGGVKRAITLENAMISGGAGEHLLASIRPALREKVLFCGGFPDVFITHGRNAELFKQYGIDPETLAKRVLKLIK